MEDDSCDGKTEYPLSPKSGGKKLKLNDGSSQDSLEEKNDSISNVEKDDNIDSGVSADKSESTSSDPILTPTEGPSNEVINAAPSSSNVHAILLNFRRPRRERNYRKRKIPSRDTDSNDSSTDSDDLSCDENTPRATQDDDSHSDTEFSEYFPRYHATLSDISSLGLATSSESGNNSDSEDMLLLESESDTEDEVSMWTRPLDYNSEPDENENDKEKVPSVLEKIRPKNNYLILREIINREMGITYPCGKIIKDDIMFEKKFYGSLHTVYRLRKLHHLNKHKGCVNSINFHPEGQLLVSGSDDTNVIVWDWARNRALQSIKTGHKSNVFQSKFLHLNARSQLNIVTCARDGQVRLVQCGPSGLGLSGDGAGVARRRLGAHARAAHKLHVSAHEPHLVVSAGEDGLVMQCDVRAEKANRLFQVKEQGTVIPLYSVSGHPLDTHEMVVAGKDKFVRLYDKRKSTKPLSMYCPSLLYNNASAAKKKLGQAMMHLTCAVYNHDGSEILGSYNDENIYLFDTKKDVYEKDQTEKDGYTYCYAGHRNSATFKGVAFFGPQSQYVVSGSDCSYIYIWEKKSEAIVQWMAGDENGVVNCIEAHPRFPVLATSGLDKDVKIWIPRGHTDPEFKGLESVVRENSVSLRAPLFEDFLPTLYSAWRDRREGRRGARRRDEPSPTSLEFEGNVCTIA